MPNGRLVFVDIDTQRDFLDPDGALFIPGSISIRSNLGRLIRFARDRSIPVIASACAHTPDEPDPEPFPPHCLVGSKGQARIEGTNCADSVVIGVDARFDGDIGGHATIEKRHYDLFRNPNAHRIFQVAGRDDPTFVVFGVATDYCVKAAVLGLRERRYQVAVVVDAIRAVNPEEEPGVIEEFLRAGATLVMTDVVCAGCPD